MKKISFAIIITCMCLVKRGFHLFKKMESLLTINTIVMGKTFILAILILLSLGVSGQDAFLSNATSKWNIGYHCVDEGPIHPYDFWTTGFYYAEGDTVMNEKHFQKLFACDDSLCSRSNFKNYIREEGGRIFFANRTEELIQYDFNLEKGDTLILDFLWDVSREAPLYVRIDSVKAIDFLDKKTRKVQYVTIFDYYKRRLGDYSVNDIFVEGIGSQMFGIEIPRLFMTGNSGCSPEALLCFYSDGKLVYSNTEINNCYLSTEVQQLKKQTDLAQVFAVNGILEIRLNNAVNGKLSVFDLQGKQIFAQTINKSVNQFCMPEFGIFLYRFKTEKGEVQTGKILIK